MARFAIVAIVLLASSTGALSRGITSRETAEGAADDDANTAAIRDILQKISTGESSAKDDAKLMEIIREEIARTALEIKSPEGSIEAAAKRAQILVYELTSAYTSAIYKSKSTENSRQIFARFQAVVQAIVEFIKNGQFLA